MHPRLVISMSFGVSTLGSEGLDWQLMHWLRRRRDKVCAVKQAQFARILQALSNVGPRFAELLKAHWNFKQSGLPSALRRNLTPLPLSTLSTIRDVRLTSSRFFRSSYSALASSIIACARARSRSISSIFSFCSASKSRVAASFSL